MQFAIGSYCPLLLHVSTPLPLHETVPGVHAWQTPVTLQVPPAQTVPCGFGAKVQVFDAQTALRQALLDGGHWPADEHCTQMPVAGLQLGVAPEQAGWAVYCPFAPQTSGTLPLQIDVFGVQRLHCPAPSHLPAPPMQAVFTALGVVPHAFAAQVAVIHSFAAGHWAAAVHSTHAEDAVSQ